MNLYDRVKKWFGFGKVSNSYETAWQPLSAYLSQLADYDTSLTRAQALQFDPVKQAVSLISGHISKVPIDVFKSLGDGKEKDKAHPASKLLSGIHGKVNPYQSKQNWLQSCMVDLVLDGNSYSHIIRDGGLRPLEIHRLEPCDITPVKESGVIYYEYRTDTQPVIIPARDMIHLRGMGCELEGWGLLKTGSKTIRLGLAQERYAYLFFENGGVPQIILSAPFALQDETRKRLKQELKADRDGPEAAYDPMLLEEGMTAATVSFNPEQSQMIESRKFSIKSIANQAGIGSFKLGDSERIAYNSLEMEQQAFLDECLDYYLVLIEAEFNDKLLKQQEKETHTIEFNRESLVRTDYTKKVSGLTALVQAKIITVNEARGYLNLNPIEGGDSVIEDSQPAAEPEPDKGNDNEQPEPRDTDI